MKSFQTRQSIIPSSWLDRITTGILITMIPILYCFAFLVVLPDVYQRGTAIYWINLIFGHFLVSNMIGNYVFLLLCDTSMRVNAKEKREAQLLWSRCQACNERVPPRARHCTVCSTCILTRDHHCIFIGYCIGQHNRRFFTMFLYHILVGFSYATYCTNLFITKHVCIGLPELIVELLFPPLIFIIGPDTVLHAVYVLLYVALLLVTAMVWLLAMWNTLLIMRGFVPIEANNHDLFRRRSNSTVLENIKEVLGARWYLTWINPLIASQLPLTGG